jgi:hypothetical protein
MRYSGVQCGIIVVPQSHLSSGRPIYPMSRRCAVSFPANCQSVPGCRWRSHRGQTSGGASTFRTRFRRRHVSAYWPSAMNSAASACRGSRYLAPRLRIYASLRLLSRAAGRQSTFPTMAPSLAGVTMLAEDRRCGSSVVASHQISRHKLPRSKASTADISTTRPDSSRSLRHAPVYRAGGKLQHRHALRSVSYCPSNTAITVFADRHGAVAALHWWFRAAPRCCTKPYKLKCRRDSPERWLKKRGSGQCHAIPKG